MWSEALLSSATDVENAVFLILCLGETRALIQLNQTYSCKFQIKSARGTCNMPLPESVLVQIIEFWLFSLSLLD